MFRLHVEGFGPLREASVSPRPLTIFIGPNNAGKSYLAVLLYAIYSSLDKLNLYQIFYQTWMTKQVRNSLQQWLRGTTASGKIPFKELPGDFQELLNQAVSEIFSEHYINALHEELQRCFASETSELVSKYAERKVSRLCFLIEQSQPPWQLKFEIKNGRPYNKKIRLDLQEQMLDLNWLRSLLGATLSDHEFRLFLITQITQELISKMWSAPRNVYYFPAARSGILQAHKLVASSLVRRAPLAGIVPLGIPPLSGVIADFISHLLRLESRRESRAHSVAEVAEFLESEVTQGRIDLKPTETRFEYPEIYYESSGVRLPLHRSSSMVSELAPLVLFFKYVIQKGDLVIIEEPEAHLHPDNQLKLAQTIVRLIREGVRVLITTHSDYLVHQINNFIRLSQIPDRTRRAKELRYGENDYLKPEEVAAYLFSFEETGMTSVKELKISKEDGIPEDEFTRIAEQLYQKTVKLSRFIE